MDKKAIIEYHEIINTFEVMVDAMKWLREEKNDYSYSAIIDVAELQLKNLRKFCINYVGEVEM